MSHYKLDHCPNRKYLSSDVTIKSMHHDYNEKHNPVAYSTYFHVFKSLNIGFDSPTQDECPKCKENKIHKNSIQNNHVEIECNECINFEAHHNLYKSARKEYKLDNKKENGPNSLIYCVDMQKVLIIPKMSTKNSFFVSRMVVFNETFAPMGKNGGEQKNHCVLWNESITGRNAADVTSSYLKIIINSKREVTEFIFWADNCAAQNKNFILFSSMLTIINQPWGPTKICLKYFEPGHSFMKADSIHGQIGKKWKAEGEILDMNDLIKIIENANEQNLVTLMEPHDFYNFENKCHKRTKNKEIPYLDELKVAEFRKGKKISKHFLSFNCKHFLAFFYTFQKFSTLFLTFSDIF